MTPGLRLLPATPLFGRGTQKGGCEVPSCHGPVAALLVFTGFAARSLDRALGLSQLDGCAWGSAAPALGPVAAAVPLTARSRVLRARTTPSTTR